MNQAIPASAPGRRFLSVIIPAYNAAKTLGEQLDALKGQAYEGDWEIVVVNNGSTDDTVNMVQKHQQLMPRLRLVHALAKQNRSYARNIAAREAKGDAFLFCDADDIVAPGWVSALGTAIEKQDIVIGPIEVHTLDSDAPQQPYYFRLSLKEPYLNFLPVAMSSNCAISRQAFEAIGGFGNKP
jgi:glycosyltransferase involved in cell wall biosynthesis